jgi:hypothetical protein
MISLVKIEIYFKIRIGASLQSRAVDFAATHPVFLLNKEMYFLHLLPDVWLKKLPKFGKMNFGIA